MFIIKNKHIFLSLLLLILFPIFTQTVENSKLFLSDAEQTWLDNHRIIRISNSMDWPPFDYVVNGEPKGYSIDYVKLITDKLGITVEWVNGKTWKELESLVRTKDIDIIHTISISEERQEYLNFTKPFLNNPRAVFKRSNDFSINTFEDLSGKTVAVVENYFSHTFIKKNYPDIKLRIFKTTIEAITSVIYKKSDVYIDRIAVTNYILKEHKLTGLVNAFVLNNANISGEELRIATRKDWAPLIPILEKAMDNISSEEYKFMDYKYDMAIKKLNITEIYLTDIEKEWIEKNPVIKVHNEESWAPFNFNKSSTPMGYSIDYIKLLAKKSGLKIEFITGPTWNEFLDMIKKDELDVMLNIVPTVERGKFLNFTEPYLTLSPTLFAKLGDNIITDITDLFGKTFAIQKGFYYEDVLKRFPEINLLYVDSTEQAILALSRGEADVMLGIQAIVDYLCNKLHISNITPGGSLGSMYSGPIKTVIGVQKQLVILRNILQKAMDNVTSTEILGIENLWFNRFKSLSYEDSNNNIVAKSVLLIFILLIIFIVMIYVGTKILRVKQCNPIIKHYNSDVKRIRFISITTLCFSITIIILLMILILNNSKENDIKNYTESLITVKDATKEAVNTWIESRLKQVEFDADDNYLSSILTAELNPVDKKNNLMSYILTKKNRDNWSDFYIINGNGINIISSDLGEVGLENLIVNSRPELFIKLFLGETVFMPPINGRFKTDEKVMFYAAPITDSKGHVLAGLLYRENPNKRINKILNNGVIGKTGETYTFDSNGLITSEIKYNQTLIDQNLVFQGDSSLFNTSLINTLMYNSAKFIFDGYSDRSYIDYRNVTVLGAWSWIPELNYGIVTEIDLNDALSSYYANRTVIVIIISIVLLMTIGTSIFTIFFGEKANKSLTKLNIGLEDRVKRHTKDLSSANKKLKNTLEALTHPFYVIDVNTYKIVLANGAARKLMNKEHSTCYALLHNRDTTCNNLEHPCPLDEIKKSKRPSQVEHLHYDKDGNEQYVEVYGYPILNDYGDLTHMIEYTLDITERKRSEQNLLKVNKLMEFAAETAKLAYWELDLKSLNLTLNEQFYKLLETTSIKENGFIKPLIDYRNDFMIDEDVSVLEEHFETAIRSHISYLDQMEYRFVTRKGIIRYALVKFTVYHDENNSAEKCVGIHLDITEQKENEFDINKIESYLKL